MSQTLDPAAFAVSFQLLAEIAFGATARIDLCRAVKAYRPGIEGMLLAVKRLHPHIAEDPGFANQFLDEVWMTAALKSPNVVEVRGWGTDEQGAYLAVELVEGVALSRLMKTVFETHEVFSERMVVFIGSRLCRGLNAAHALRAPNGELLNLVHRDLTPANVLLGFNGDVKIADFGLAKAKQRLTKTLTGMRKGEPTYMAPEQARADDIDARADLFALGVILFELFAGRRPWLAKSDFEMVTVTARDPPADLRELRPKIDKELVNVVNRCLVKDPDGRFQSAAEIGERLENWLSVHGYQEGNEDALARFVRRNAMKQMRWFERAVTGELAPKPKVGRNLPPRVPTYVDTGERMPAVKPDRAPPPPPAAGARARPPMPPPRTPPPPPPAPQGSPYAAPAPGSPPGGARSHMRATIPGGLAGAAWTPAPTAPAAGPQPTDEETGVTDPAWRIARQVQAQPPVIAEKHDGGDLEGDTDGGEEIPTLIQSGSPQLAALRSKHAKPKDPAALQAFTGLPRGAAPVMSDEDSDLRTTSIKKVDVGQLPPNPLGPVPARLAVPEGISDMDSEEFPTEPVRGVDLSQAGLRRPTQRSEPTRPAGLPPQGSHKATALDAPRVLPGKIAPAPPGVPAPPSPAQAGSQASPRNGASTTPLPSFGQQGAPLPSFGSPSSPSFRVPPPPPPFEAGEPPFTTGVPGGAPFTTGSPGGAPQGRGSNADDVEVIDRGKIGRAITEDIVVAEADRLAIEAVRRSEDARAAALRAERKAAVAKLAGEAAMIAADAVRLARSMGLAAAAKRLDEARKLEAAMDRPESVAAARGQTYDAANSGESTAVLGPGSGAGATVPLPITSSLPNPGLSLSSSPSTLGAQPPAPKAIPPAPVPMQRSGAFFPEPSSAVTAQGASSTAPFPKLPSTQPLFPVETPAGGVPLQSTEDIRAKFRPQMFGMPPLAIAGLGIVAFCIVFLILWLFFG